MAGSHHNHELAGQGRPDGKEDGEQRSCECGNEELQLHGKYWERRQSAICTGGQQSGYDSIYVHWADDDGTGHADEPAGRHIYGNRRYISSSNY